MNTPNIYNKSYIHTFIHTYTHTHTFIEKKTWRYDTGGRTARPGKKKQREKEKKKKKEEKPGGMIPAAAQRDFAKRKTEREKKKEKKTWRYDTGGRTARRRRPVARAPVKAPEENTFYSKRTLSIVIEHFL